MISGLRRHQEMVMPADEIDENVHSLEADEAITGSLLDVVTIRLGARWH